MMKRIALLLLGLGLASGAVAQENAKLELNKSYDFNVSGCVDKKDILEIVDYANAHQGDGASAFYQKQAEGKCGRMVFRGTITSFLISFHDALIGDQSVVEYDVDGKTVYGIVSKEDLVLTAI